MFLARTAPARLGFDQRSYECVTCNHIDRVIVESHAAKWRASKLRPAV